MNIWASGDLHLSFEPRIEKPMDIFGPQWNGHFEKIAGDWRARVTDEDIVLLMPVGYPSASSVPSPKHTASKAMDELVKVRRRFENPLFKAGTFLAPGHLKRK